MNLYIAFEYAFIYGCLHSTSFKLKIYAYVVYVSYRID
jgi:hypothetical protein